MLNQIIFAVIQAATEFLPISSSGHLALFSNVFNLHKGDIFFFTILHLASLFAVLIFTRQEISELFKFDKKAKNLWSYLIIGTLPAALAGYYFGSMFKSVFSSLFSLGLLFLVMGYILLLTRHTKVYSKLNYQNSFAIGLAQIMAIFPGISRSGVTISSGMFLGLKKERAMKFSFLLFIPLVLGATILEFGNAYFSWSLVVSFFVTFVLSLFFLNLLLGVVKKNKFWLFSFYCFVVGILSLVLHFLGF